MKLDFQQCPKVLLCHNVDFWKTSQPEVQLSLTNRAAHLFNKQWCGYLSKNAFLSRYLVILVQTVRAVVRFPKVGPAGPRPLGGGVSGPLQTSPSPRGLPCRFDGCWSNSRRVCTWRPGGKTGFLAPRLSGSLKVIHQRTGPGTNPGGDAKLCQGNPCTYAIGLISWAVNCHQAV